MCHGIERTSGDIQTTNVILAPSGGASALVQFTSLKKSSALALPYLLLCFGNSFKTRLSRSKCPKIAGGWGFALDLHGELTALPKLPSWIKPGEKEREEIGKD